VISKIHIALKNREYRKSAPFEWLCTLFERNIGKNVPLWHNFPRKLISGLEKNATFGLFWQGFYPSFSILRIAGISNLFGRIPWV